MRKDRSSYAPILTNNPLRTALDSAIHRQAQLVIKKRPQVSFVVGVIQQVFKRDKLVDEYPTKAAAFVEKMLDEVRNIGLSQPIIDRFVGRANASIDELIDLLRSQADISILLPSFNEVEKELNIALYTLHGRLIHQLTTTNHETTLDLPKLPQGAYFLKVTSTQGEIWVKKLIKIP